MAPLLLKSQLSSFLANLSSENYSDLSQLARIGLLSHIILS